MNDNEKITTEEVARMFGVPADLLATIRDSGMGTSTTRAEIGDLEFLKEHTVGIISKFATSTMAENIKLRDLIHLQEDYIKLLGEELDELAGIAIVHGWQSKRAWAGAEIRDKIEKVKNALK